MQSIRGIISGKYLIAVLLLLALTTTAYAATTINISTPTYQTYQGILFNVTGNFTASFKGFFVAHVSQTPSSAPCPWTNNGECHTAITSGDWVLIIQLTSVGSSSSTTITFTITVQWNYGSNVYQYTPLNTLTFKGPYSSGQTMTFTLDTGVNSFSAPTGIVVTVQ
jgi:hypothetical protein